jgi:exodeoxyribonuclease-5
VLRSKGVTRAQTIHSLIYIPAEIVTYTPVVQPDGTTRQVLSKGVEFNLRDELADAAGMLVDEASMVSSKLHADLRSFGLPIIFVGDHGQLAPVGDDPGLMRDPHFRLETPHRNANEIRHFAAHLRQGNPARAWEHVSGSGERVQFFSSTQIVEQMRTVDQTLVPFNSMRVNFNRRYRAIALGHHGDSPMPGDRLIVLRNTRRYDLFNGQQVIAKSVQPNNRISLLTEGGRLVEVSYTPAAFNQAKPEFDHDPNSPVPLDFAYAATVHKAHGSEWRTGAVVEGRCQ